MTAIIGTLGLKATCGSVAVKPLVFDTRFRVLLQRIAKCILVIMIKCISVPLNLIPVWQRAFYTYRFFEPQVALKFQ